MAHQVASFSSGSPNSSIRQPYKMTSLVSKHTLQTAYTTESFKNKSSGACERPSNASYLVEVLFKNINNSGSMSDHIIDQRNEFEEIPTRNWGLEDVSDYPNAWGYFYGGHSSTQAQRHALRFGIPMFFGLGTGVFVRANRYYHVPKAYRKELPASVKEVQIGAKKVNVIQEGLFPFRMWSVTAGQYFSLNLKCLVIEDFEPDKAPKSAVDVFFGADSILPFRINDGPREFRDGAIEIDINFHYDGLAQEYRDVGAWTQSTLQEPWLRPLIWSVPAAGLEHFRRVEEKWRAQLKSGALSVTAAAASPP